MAKHPLISAKKDLPAARVNGVVISTDKVEAGLQAVLEPYKDAKGKVRLSQPERYAARKQVIENLIMRELLYQEGCKRGIKATREELQHATELSAREYGTEDQFRAMLLMTGSSPDEFGEQLQKDLIINKMAVSLVKGKKRQVSSKDAKKYYEEHLEEMKGPEARKILHIMAQLDRYASSEEEQKKRKLLGKINSRDKFEKVVSKGSEKATGFKSEDLGFVTKGRFHPLLEPIAFRLEEGQISRVIRTQEGLHLLMVTSVVKEGDVIPFDLIKEEIKNKLYEMRSVLIISRFSDELKKKAQVEILDRIADNKLEQEKS